MGSDNGVGTRTSSFGVPDKQASSATDSDAAAAAAVGLNLKLQPAESFPSEIMSAHHHHDHHRPLSSVDAGGPTCSNGTEEVVGRRPISSGSNTYRDAAAAAASTISDAAAVFVRTCVQPFDISTTTTAFNSPVSFGSMYNLKSSNNNDPEPGRCKRTDGKKWRCSRDVAPHHKYCERHMHRGRPRSRKHVEVHGGPGSTTTTTTTANKKTRLHHASPPSPAVPPPPPKFYRSTTIPSTETIPFFADTKILEPNRGFNGVVEGEMVTIDPSSEQQWLNLVKTNMGFRTEGSIYNTSDYRDLEPLNLESYTNYCTSQGIIQQNDEFNFFLNPDLVSFDNHHPQQIDTTRSFIDAWSNENHNKDNESPTVSTRGNLSPSSLTLSMAMAAGDALDEDEMGQIQTGLGANPVSWVGTSATVGGPLAEVLGPSTGPASPCGVSPPTTTVSSPSGVLQRTMISQSDSSVCNSPTFGGSAAAPPEVVAFQWRVHGSNWTLELEFETWDRSFPLLGIEGWLSAPGGILEWMGMAWQIPSEGCLNNRGGMVFFEKSGMSGESNDLHSCLSGCNRCLGSCCGCHSHRNGTSLIDVSGLGHSIYIGTVLTQCNASSAAAAAAAARAELKTSRGAGELITMFYVFFGAWQTHS
ncbi:hypothetical protein RJ640_028304 [Escallonia rubra]|uniref:Growth-regulating factor n=1 Tax=Escallonia rubra TaxID=112253 RepID=A0AA88UUP4_9ASTE|nr:hypothetical protein RJ640_028304 [Escallonia rubra]